MINSAFAQTRKLDSLILIVKTTKEDTTKAKLYNQIAIEFRKEGSLKKMIEYSEMSLKFCSNKKYPKGFFKANYIIWLALNDSGVTFYEDAIYPRALDLYTKSMPYAKLSNDFANLGYAYSNIGNVFKKMNDYAKAHQYYFDALEIRKKINDKRTLCIAYNNLGHVFKNIKDEDCYKINISADNKLSKALDCYQNALIASASINEVGGMAASYASIASVYESRGQYPMCYESYKKNLELNLTIKQEKNISVSYNKIAKLLMLQREEDFKLEGLDFKYKDSLIYFNLTKSLFYAEQTKALETKRDIYKSLAKFYEEKNNFKEAFYYHKKFKLYHDSIYNDDNSDKMSEIFTSFEAEKKEIQFKIDKEKADLLFNEELKQKQIIYDFEKRELSLKSENEKDEILFQETKKRKEIDDAFNNKMLINKIEQDKQQEVNRLNQKRKNTIIGFVVFGLIVLVCFSIFIYRRLRISKEQNIIIENQKKEVETQKNLVEEKHKEITDSINYAERIQRALLASEKMLDDNLSNYFILFKPKDVVSGDFYWATKLSSGSFILVTADSTGHGVPGAIMSIVNIASLKEAVVQGIESPDLILCETRRLIIENLKNDGSAEGGKDGMDASLLSFNFNNNSMTCACGNSPIWIIRDKTLIEIKPDRMPIGKHDNDKIPFTLHTIDLQKGDTIYTLTDGFPDQFGGEGGKKFKSKRLQEILLSIANEPMEIQKQKLNDSFDNWKGDLEQVDDVLIFGLRV